MGIPSFYRQLCRKFPDIVGSDIPENKSEWLCLDFNCAMYHVLRTMPAYTGEPAWETQLQRAIAEYMSEIATLVKPTSGVYVSCDGVVCAAKRRQQRLRRFKGPWIHTLEEAAVAAVAAVATVATSTHTDHWDQNALTPGTAFMAALSIVLKEEAKRLSLRLKVPVIVSDTEEPGEGEHKLLAHMRSVKPASCAIYGLDADLILLALLLEADTAATVTLIREAQEFEGGTKDKWRNLDIGSLRKALLPLAGPDKIRDFVAGMSLLGNDFLPRSLSRTVRDNGIPGLISSLKKLWVDREQLVGGDGSIVLESLLKIIQGWAETEEADIMNTIQNALRSANYSGAGSSSAAATGEEETARKAFQGQPAMWCSIGRLANGGRLRSDWQRIYREQWRFGADGIAEYIYGVAWVWDYYSGKPVDWGWAYDAHLPPLWSDIAAWMTLHPQPSLLSLSLLLPLALPDQKKQPLPSWLHLLSVLPVDSIERLLPAHRGKQIVNANNWWWPTSWCLFDVGRTQIWECEIMIPIIPESVLRDWSDKNDLITLAA